MSDVAASREARVYPHNIEAEQALLGAILINNDALDRCGALSAEHFYDPLHARIFSAIYADVVAGTRSTPVTLKSQFEGESVGNITVAQYLGRLVSHATSIINARDYAQTIRDLWVRRELLTVISEASEMACDVGGISSAELLDVIETQLFALGGNGANASHEMTAPEAVEAAIAQLDAAYRHDGKLAGLSSGFADLDKALGGLSPENLYIIAGRPSMGKSALAANIAFSVAKRLLGIHKMRAQGEAGKMGEVSFYSLEMSAEQLMQRQLAAETGIPVDWQRRGDVREEGFRQLVEAGRTVAKLPFHIDSTGSLSIGQLMARARRRKRLFDTRLIVVDYLQLMITGQKRRENRVTEVSEISMALKALAKELKIPVIALSQLSRQVESREDKRPLLSDLRESGAIEQDADVVMFVFREEYYLQRAEPSPSDVEKYQAWSVRMAEVTGVAEVILAKHRHAGIGAVKMSFDGARTSFCDLAPGRVF